MLQQLGWVFLFSTNPPKKMPSNIKFVNPASLLVISPVGNNKQLHAPIKDLCTIYVENLQYGSTVFIEAVVTHSGSRICYQI